VGKSSGKRCFAMKNVPVNSREVGTSIDRNLKQKEAFRDAVSQYRTSPTGGISRSPSVNPRS